MLFFLYSFLLYIQRLCFSVPRITLPKKSSAAQPNSPQNARFKKLSSAAPFLYINIAVFGPKGKTRKKLKTILFKLIDYIK